MYTIFNDGNLLAVVFVKDVIQKGGLSTSKEALRIISKFANTFKDQRATVLTSSWRYG